MTPYDIDLDRNAANFQPLPRCPFWSGRHRYFPTTRRSFTDRCAGATASSTRARAGSPRRPARHRDAATPSVVLANTPAMLECYYGVPMTGAVLNTINTRLDAATIAFQLDHGEARVLIVDREFSKL